MAGLAKTDNFLLSTATVMLGLPEDLYNLNPTDHSIGLVKNFTISAEPAYTELTQGVKGDIVFSVLTSNPTRAAMEVYEYTAKNLAYALGLDGSEYGAKTVHTQVNGAIAASPATDELVVDSATGLTAGDTILIDVNGDDNFVIRKILSVATNTLTLNADLPAIPDNAKVYEVNSVGIGSKDEQPFLAAAIAGKLANGEHAVIYLPKVRVSKGFNMAFVSDNYGNLPFELTLYDLVTTDPKYTDFNGLKAKVFRK